MEKERFVYLDEGEEDFIIDRETDTRYNLCEDCGQSLCELLNELNKKVDEDG